ncbi:MAG: AIM24 family protein [Mycobacteriales bacterium]
MTLEMQLVGNAMQMAVATLTPGQTVYCEAGKFLFSSGDVLMETKLSAPSAAGQNAAPAGGLGGLMRGALDVGKRMLAGESFAYQHFSTRGGDGLVAFAGVLPGEMKLLELDGATTWFAEKDAFVAAEAGVRSDVAFSGLRQGFAGGEGFVLQKFTGTGTLLIAGAGNFIEIDPADYGGTLKVDTGCIVAFESTVSYGIERVGRLNRQGAMTALFGGEGLSLATLTGRGKVVLQSMTVEALASALAKFARRGDGDNGTTGLGSIGGLLGGRGG